MTKTRFTQWIVLACIGSLAACTSGEGGTAGNTELNVIVPNGTDPSPLVSPDGNNGSSAPDLIDIQSVEYTINCAGNDEVFLDNGASFPDEVSINGSLEVQDGRTNPAAIYGDPTIDGQAEVWQGFMDLPPGPCSIQLRARDGDQEVICSADETFNVAVDSSTKVNMVLICDISFQAPVGMLDLDATFSFNVANFCPDLFIFNAIEPTPLERPLFIAALGGVCASDGVTACVSISDPVCGGAPCVTLLAATTSAEVRFRDGDSSCGGAGEDSACDPQTCVVTPSPTGPGNDLTCTPDNPDPGVTTTITCTSNPAAGQTETVLIDCNKDFIPDNVPFGTAAVCQIGPGNNLGNLPTDPADAAPDQVLQLDANSDFLVGCVPPSGIPGFFPPGEPGAVITCTAVTTDGDSDCDKTKEFTVTCPGLTPCDQYAADGFVCDDGTACTTDTCNDAGAVAGSCGAADNGSCCETANVADGLDCSVEQPPLSECQAGVCTSLACTSDAQCADTDANSCTSPQTCDLVVGSPTEGQCIPIPPGNEPSGTSCDDGLGPLSGACDGAGACQDICSFNPACPDDSNVCTVPACDPADGTCSLAPGNEGGTCDFNPGLADGLCQLGTCIFAPDTCNFVATGSDATPQLQTVTVGCTNNVTAAQSPFPFILSVDAPVAILSNTSFNVTFGGVGFFPEFFLDAAQGVVCGGVKVAQLVDFRSTVQVRSGALGPDVQLVADPSTLTPGPVRFCNFPTAQTCSCPAGTPLGSSCADAGCLGGTCNAAVILQDLPVIDGTPSGPANVCWGEIGECTANNCSVNTAEACLFDTDCPDFATGETCLLVGQGTTCTATTDCGAGQICFNKPVVACTVDSDCSGGTTGPCLPACQSNNSACPIPGPIIPAACDCSACDALGPAKRTQCATNGFCQNGSLTLFLQDGVGTYTADASGNVLFGWSDGQGTINGTNPAGGVVPGLSICPTGSDCGTVPGRLDGCYQLPLANFANPVPPIGIRVNASGLAVPIQCAQGEDGGECTTAPPASAGTGVGCLSDADCGAGETCVGVGVDDDVICPTPDGVLISCPINTP